MRPEVTAFRDLEALVRNLSDQLAGYRRRALAAEARTRELEALTDDLRVANATATSAVQRAQSEIDALTTSHRASVEREAMARDALAREVLARDASSRDGGGAGGDRLQDDADDAGLFPNPSRDPVRSERALARENAELKTRLADATERTKSLAERIRFLRQQVTQVSEK